MNWRNHITKPIKLVIWELDDTVWAGTLSEEKVKIYSYPNLPEKIIHMSIFIVKSRG